MANPDGSQLSQWLTWKDGIEGGAIAVDFEVARKLRDSCSALRAELEMALGEVDWVSNVKGMGTLQSGIDLARKFSLKASGGEDSLEKSLLSHIDVLNEMEAYFQECVTRYFAVEAENAGRLARHEVSGS
ncbi:MULTISPECIES: hypothetical protein [Rhodococcus]|uniref:Excreted virulence factor EspC (Type VII ESX diderm) n=1 Tax=Nocardia globerula TaxID=1818 RepID=A0A652YJK7_NOCGL|nr:hypothetical protein [Rhodococcus globerulus]PVX66715.1 hypothetical protein C8E04_4056 [Rhodococcus globerulus]